MNRRVKVLVGRSVRQRCTIPCVYKVRQAFVVIVNALLLPYLLIMFINWQALPFLNILQLLEYSG